MRPHLECCGLLWGLWHRLHHAVDESSRKESVALVQGVTVLTTRLPRVFVILVLNSLKLVVNQLLLLLDVSKHILALWQRYEVGEDLRVFVVEVAQLGQSDLGLGLLLVKSLEELIDVVKNEIVFEYAD